MNSVPIAIVGMACRFPKLDGMSELWEGLMSGLNAIDTVPSDRWDADRYFSKDEAAKGKAYIRRGGFINQDPKTFDASFFGISPREAENMDPQQRLMLEVVWEAFENCGLILPEYAGKQVGVYVGGFMLDHMITQMAFSNRSQINQHSAAGMMMTMLSNRVSHTYDFRGPSLSIDTACSSSLVSFHVACQDIWRGACELAVAGGCSVMMRPEYPMGMCKGGFLSRDGESKSFDARGDGYGRGEGAGAILLKPLEKALENGDQILATVLATGTNQDGRTAGISLPNGDAQRQLIEQVCQENSIDLNSVDYVECHGTGTSVGDPTECGAIGATYGKNRTSKAPVVVGSIKSNVGHLEAAAGVAGVIKAVLTLANRKSVPLGNLQQPNTEIPFSELGIRLSNAQIDLGKPGQTLRAAVNSFGYGGSNAHVILESVDGIAEFKKNTPKQSTQLKNRKLKNTTSAVILNELESKDENEFPFVIPVTGRSEQSLRMNAERLSQFLSKGNCSIHDAIYTQASRRAHLSHRAVAMGRNREELIHSLALIGESQQHDLLVQDSKPFLGKDEPVFVFTGMGPQWWSMGQQLYRTQPVYRTAVEGADEIFRELSGFSILSEMLKAEAESRIQQTVNAQPANFVIQLGILAMLENAGVRPGLVVGHSVGELGAAYAAGVLSLRDALLVSYHRSQLQAEAAGTGGMLAVGLGKKDALERLAGYEELVSLAAINSPSTVTLAGDVGALSKIGEKLTEDGIFNRELEVEIPYHSPLMDPLKPRLEAALAEVSPSRPTTRVYSTVTGEAVEEASFGASYWPENIREPVEFEKAIRGILEEGYNTFVEIGPHPVLSSAMNGVFKSAGKECRLIHTLRRNLPDEIKCVQRAAMSVFAAGCDIDWSSHVDSQSFVPLPNYAWDRQTFWSENDRAQQDRVNPIIYPILGTQETLSAPVWRNDFDHQPVSYLRDHVVSGMPILPAAGYLEALLELASIQFSDAAGFAIRDVEILRPAIITSDRGLDFTTTYDPHSQQATQRSLDNGKLGIGTEHLRAGVYGLTEAKAEKLDIERLRSSCTELQDVGAFYQSLNQLGLSYGPMFQTVSQLHQSKTGEMISLVEIAPSLEHDLRKYHLHPTMLDGCFQSLMALLGSQETTYLPTHIEELKFHRNAGDKPRAEAPRRVWCIGKLAQRTARTLQCDLTLVEDDGTVVASIQGLRATASNRSTQRIDKFGEPVKRQVLGYEWEYGDVPSEPKRLGHWLMVGDAGETSSFVSSRLEGYGASVVGKVAYGTEFEARGNEFCIPHDSADDASQVLEHCGDLDGVLFLHSLDEELNDTTGAKQIAALISFTKALLKIPSSARPRVYVVTKGAFEIPDQPVELIPASAAVNGWVRVACCELEGFRFSSIDIDDESDEAILEALSLELVCDEPEDECALRGEWRYVSVLRENNLLSADVVEPGHVSDSLGIKVRPLGNDLESIGTVRVLADEIDDHLENEIVVRVEKAKLPASLLQDQSSEDISEPCVEFVGRVVHLGSQVTDLETGDMVCGLGPAELASHLRGERSDFYLAKVPADSHGGKLVTSFLNSASAKRALQKHELAAGDRALVQFCAIGIAIANELQKSGVEVTVVTDDVESIPGEIRESFRVSLASSSAILEVVETDGPFDLLAANIEDWNREHGFANLRFGAGLVDIAEVATTLPLPPRIGTVSRTDLAVLQADRTRFEEAIQRSIDEIAVADEKIPEPFEVSIADLAWKKLPLGNTESALVLSYETRGRDLPLVRQLDTQFSADATYLVTGGLGGFGQKTASWLVNHGARHLVLVGRSGAASKDKQDFVRSLEARGATVVAAACDTGDREQLDVLFQQISSKMPPLKGVFHSAAVILDEPIAETNLDAFHQVMRAKALSAWHLHELTQSMELDHFVMYSSLSNQIGNSRQGAYCAANGFLNGLAWYRKSLGLPGMSVNWGAIADVGVVAEDEKLELFLKSVGLRGLPAMEGLELLRTAMAREVHQFGVVVIKSWADWARYETLGARSPRFAEVIAADANNSENENKTQLLQELAELAVPEQVDLMGQLIVEIVASVLKADPSSTPLDRPINELGIDSLMGTEIQLLFETKLGIAISVLELIGEATIRSLASKTVDSLQPELETLVNSTARDTKTEVVSPAG